MILQIRDMPEDVLNGMITTWTDINGLKHMVITKRQNKGKPDEETDEEMAERHAGKVAALLKRFPIKRGGGMATAIVEDGAIVAVFAGQDMSQLQTELILSFDQPTTIQVREDLSISSGTLIQHL